MIEQLTDRELLERAARAYWHSDIDDGACSVRWLEADQAIGYIHADNQDHNGADQEYIWNPLADDGDALRLAVRLRIHVRHFQHDVEAQVERGYWREDDGSDPCAATRRAIVRAAAEMAPATPKEQA